MKKVVIIGGMAAGCKAAARIKRLEPDYKVTIVEKKSFVSYGACGMPLFASGDVDGFFDLAKTPWGVIRDEAFFRDVKDVTTLTNTLAERIDKDAKKVFCKNVESGEEIVLDFDDLVIATGAKAFIPDLPMPVTDKISTFHNPNDAKIFRQKAQTGQIGSAIIVGGGFIGVELAEAMVSLWGLETHLIERENRLLPFSMGVEISKVLEAKYNANDIHMHLSTTVEKIELDEEENPVVFLSSGEKLTADYVFLCIGIRPDISLAKSIGVEIGKSGAIKIDKQMKTNLPGVYAAGDCVEVEHLISGKRCMLPLGSLANRQGKVMAEAICGLDTKFKGAAGAISVKVFGLTTACSGLTEKSAEQAGYDFDFVIGSWYDRPEYHPDVRALFGKLIYEKNTMKLLGLQLSGRGEVTRYIDTFTAIASNGGTVRELIDMEHAYTPPHSGPVNPLNHLGGMAEAQEEGITCIACQDFETFEGNILDVREKIEADGYPCHCEAKNYNMGEYRKHLDEYDKDVPMLVICQKGPRSYEAARYMKNIGFKNVSYLGGGIQLKQVIEE